MKARSFFITIPVLGLLMTVSGGLPHASARLDDQFVSSDAHVSRSITPTGEITGKSVIEPQQFQFPSCSYNSAMPGMGYQILPQPAPVTRRQQALFDWFSPWAISRNQALANMWFPILVLAGERNARAGRFGIAINPQWFAELDEDITIGIYAHELGHVSQAHGLIPVDALAMRYGLEGQADYFAGTLLKTSRQFSPQQMQKFADWVTPSPGDQTHAPGRIRADLMRAGYNNTP